MPALPDAAPEDAHRVEERLRRELAEAHHRARNNLQIILSLIGLYRRAYPESAGALNAIAGRIRALDAVQHQLRDAGDGPVDVRDYLQRLAAALAQAGGLGRPTVTVRGGSFAVLAKEANALGMIVAEANAADPGSESAGRIAVEIAGEPERRVILAGEGVALQRVGPTLRLIEAYAGKAGIELARADGDTRPALALTFPGAREP